MGSFANKVFLSILQSDQILLLCLACMVARAVVIAEVTAEVIDCLKVGFFLCDGLDTPAVIYSK